MTFDPQSILLAVSLALSAWTLREVVRLGQCVARLEVEISTLKSNLALPAILSSLGLSQPQNH